MCGIGAAVSPAANIVPVLLEGLRKLEFRGYESAGLAVLNGATLIETPLDMPEQNAYDVIILAVACEQFKICALGNILHVLYAPAFKCSAA